MRSRLGGMLLVALALAAPDLVAQNSPADQLFRSAWNDDVQGLNEALQRGARPDHVGTQGLTALDRAIESGAYHTAARLYELTGPTPRMLRHQAMEEAVLNHNQAELKRLAEQRFPMELRVRLFRLAALVGNVEALALLHVPAAVAQGRTNAAGGSALLFGAINGSPAVIRLLLERGAPIDQPDITGLTPLMATASLGHAEAVRLFLEGGANANRANQQGQTALDLARAHGHREVVQLLEAARAMASETPATEPARRASDLRRPDLLPSATVALVPFGSNDYSYLSGVAAGDFSELLGERLMRAVNARWVDRQMLREAEEELSLASMGLTSASQNLRVGQWLGADLLVTGGFSLDQGHGSELRMAILDAATAEVLSERTYRLPPAPGRPLPLETSDVDEVTRLLADALSEAVAVRESFRGRVALAPLFFGNVSESSERFDFVEERVLDGLESDLGVTYHVLRFPRASDALEEVDLAIGGLTDPGSDDWTNIADLYIWGTYRELEARDLPFLEVPIELEVVVWSGQGEPESELFQFSMNDFESAQESVGEWIASKAAAVSGTRPERFDHDTRRRIAQNLVERAQAVPVNEARRGQESTSPRVLRQWNLRVCLLELACFFDPGDPEIRRERLLERWNEMIVFDARPTFWKGPEFKRRWDQILEWEDHVRRYGLDWLEKMPTEGDEGRRIPYISQFRDKKVASVYVQQPFEFGAMVAPHPHQQDYVCVPDDITPLGRLRWQQEWRHRAAARLTLIEREAPERFRINPYGFVLWLRSYPGDASRRDIHERVWKLSEGFPISDNNFQGLERELNQIYSRLGEEARFAELRERFPGPAPDQPTEPRYTFSGAEERLEREAQREALLRDATLPSPLREGEIAAEVRELPIDWADTYRNQSVSWMTYDSDLLWIGASGGPQKPSMLIAYNPSNEVVDPVPEVSFEGRSQITTIIPFNRLIWVGSQAYGLVGLFPENRQTMTFTTQQGLPSDEIRSALIVDRRIYLGGGSWERGGLAYHDVGGGGWVLVRPPHEPFGQVTSLGWSEPQLFVTELRAVEGSPGRTEPFAWIYHPETTEWTNVGNRLPPRWRITRRVRGDPDGFWINNSRALGLLSGNDTPLEMHFEAPNNLANIFHDGEWTWMVDRKSHDHGNLGMTIECTLYLFHRPSRSLVTFMRIPRSGNVTAMAASDRKLWIAIDCNMGSPSCVLEIDKAPLIQQAGGQAALPPSTDVSARQP